MVSIKHISPAFRSYAGEDSLAGLAKELVRTSAERVVLVHGASMARHADALALIEGAIGERLAGRFTEVREHTPSSAVENAVGVLTDANADALVVVGGGSAVVTARAATILLAEDAPLRELATRTEEGRIVSPRLNAPKIPQWIVPSTPTTAYAKAGAAVRDMDTGERFALFDPKARAAGVFMHPAIAATAPASLVRGAALNAFAMSVDGLQSDSGDPLAEAQLLHALRILRSSLPLLVESTSGDVGVQLMWASLLAGKASDHVGTGLAQPLSHALGPLGDVGNGVVEAILLPHVMRFNLGHADAGLVNIANALAPLSAPEAASAITAVEQFLRDSSIPVRLRDTGIARAAAEAAVGHVAHDWASTKVPRRANEEDLRELLAAAW